MELLQGLALESFIENFYEDKQSAAELKEIIHTYNNDNFEKVKTRLQKPTVLAGMNVDNPEEVIYSDIKQPLKNIFKHIIIFTNDKDPKNNKTLKNIYDAVKELEKTKDVVLPEVHVFNCENVELADNGKTLTISDSDEKMVIKDESNVDTLVFARLSVQNEEKCEHIVRLLQDRGLLVLNPIEPSAVACNKYETAVLLQKNDIPQPNFALMTKDILYDEKLYEKAMKSIYKEWDIHNTDKNEKLPVVIKILDGHGGTGVALVDGKKMYAILQLIFAVSPEHNILIQKKEEGDGGDIRVHVLTLRDKQIILGAMKRVKIGGDFRSNVSLGAEAEPIKLTKEQEQLALKTALVSGLPWCAVDIMPLVKGSNKELGDNVILEINASPGTAGISEVLKFNFVNILLNELTDPSSFYIQEKIAGYRERVTIDFGNGNTKSFLAKLDTGNGAKASTIGCDSINEDGDYILASIQGEEYKFKKHGQSKAIVGQVTEPRVTVIIPCIQVGSRKLLDVEFALVDNRNKKQKVLINRDIMYRLAYQINPAKKHILEDDLAYSFKEEADKKAAEEEEKKNKDKK